MAPTAQECKEAALGLAYAVKRLEHSLDFTRAMNKWYGNEQKERPLYDRLLKIKQRLREAGNLLDITPDSQFGARGHELVKQADKDDRDIISNLEKKDPNQIHISGIMDRFEKVITKYGLAPSWIWDSSREDWYYWNVLDDSYIYKSGLILKAIQPSQSQGAVGAVGYQSVVELHGTQDPAELHGI